LNSTAVRDRLQLLAHFFQHRLDHRQCPRIQSRRSAPCKPLLIVYEPHRSRGLD
jgi:hypothetical protein